MIFLFKYPFALIFTCSLLISIQELRALPIKGTKSLLQKAWPSITQI